MRKKGRFVLEAALLTPGLCLLLVYLVFFTLYAHDYAVCCQCVYESGVKGIYRDGRSSREIEADVEADLRKKLTERLLWIKEAEVSVSASPVRLAVEAGGSGGFLPVGEIRVKQELYRIEPCASVRRCRWLVN